MKFLILSTYRTWLSGNPSEQQARRYPAKLLLGRFPISFAALPKVLGLNGPLHQVRSGSPRAFHFRLKSRY